MVDVGLHGAPGQGGVGVGGQGALTATRILGEAALSAGHEVVVGQLHGGGAACGDDDDPTGPGPGDNDFEWTGQVAEGLAIEIKGVSGSIDASWTSGGDVEVYALKEGTDDDPSTVTIEVLQHAGGVTICAMYPDAAGQPPVAGAIGAVGLLPRHVLDLAEPLGVVRHAAGVLPAPGQMDVLVRIELVLEELAATVVSAHDSQVDLSHALQGTEHD